MFNAPTNASATRVPGTIDLAISDPVLMLNEVAKRYESTERVLMEYVDNALDDAEALYRENGDAYPYPIHIALQIDRQQRTIAVQDNCRGMTRDTLERVVRNVGESKKRGQTWVNGRFGFGVHAFRAIAGGVSFQTKHAHSSHHALTMRRDQHRGIKEAKRRDEPFPTDTGTGCLVTVFDVAPEWFQSVTVATIRQEIERHFERLILRPNLRITVCEDEHPPQECGAFDYAGIDGTEIQYDLLVAYKDTPYPVRIYCKIAAQVTEKRPVSFFARDRRIGDAVEIKSFMRKSVYKTSVWSHPNLMGYIEVGDLVEPIINRDDFVRSRARTVLYEAILPVEAEIKARLAAVNQRRLDHTFAHLETGLQQALTTADITDFAVHLEEGEADGRRGWLENGRLTINTGHPDFQARLRTNRQGNPRPSNRLNAYLAGLLAAYAISASPESAEAYLAEQMDLMASLESHLRQQQKQAAR